LGALLLPSAAARTQPATELSTSAGQRPTAYAVDAGDRPIRALESGSTLFVGARGLQPNSLYEFRLGMEPGSTQSLERAASFARVSTNARGNVEPFVLWYETGVVGCATRENDGPDPRRLRFRDFDEAERALAGRTLTITGHRVPTRREPVTVRGATPAARALAVAAGPSEVSLQLPVERRTSPMVYVSNAAGCLLNAQEAGRADVHVTGRNFRAGETVDVALVPNQRVWHAGDAVTDVTAPAGASVREHRPRRAVADSDGRFTVQAWSAAAQMAGAFDVVAHRGGNFGRLGEQDLVSFAQETAFVLYLLYPPGGSQMDIAGRPVGPFPYFQFADAFARTGEDVYGAVDPTYVPAGHPGGTWAAYYVVNHRSALQWMLNKTLTDVSGGIEVHPVKPGCINGTIAVIWPGPLNTGKYDVVVDFGSTVATSAASYATDTQYNLALDFLDGAGQIGFQVADDPYALGSFPVGTDSYSTDDFFPSIGGVQQVDLRAVVRYPATAAGPGTPVAPGTHPIFIIEHGNHSSCRVAGTHATCPPAQRVKNHEGYMHLLDALASNGIIAVSIDAYDMTGWVPGWIPERGQLILKHLELWSHLNNAASFPAYPNYFTGRFAGKVDMNRIGISGHSRGGEASVSAWVQNAALASQFNITAVSSIAPVDFQGYTLGDVPYFLILPAADGDVWDLQGQRIYDRAGGASESITKSLINVYGASHNFFNTVWAADGDDSPASRQDFIPAGAQQKIGEAYLAAFSRAVLRNETVYDDLFRNRLTFPTTAGYKIYPARHEKSHTRLVSGGVPADLVGGGGATLASVTNPAPHQTQVTRVGWSSTSGTMTYTVPVGKRDASGFEVLAFRVAQTWAAANPPAASQNFMVELVGGGITRATYAGQFDAVPRPYPHPYGSQYTTMSSVRVPLHSFIMNNSGLPLNNIDTVRFRFTWPATGEIYVDDVEFSR
jgi:hypothetical protein